MNWDLYFKEYKVNEESIWLNNCGTTPIGERQLKAVQNYLNGYALNGIFTEVEKYSQVKKTITRILSSLIKCSEEEIGLIHNTSEGINFISQELKLKTGDEILLLENEYPSNVYPFEHWQSKSVQLKFIPNANTPNQFYENFINTVSKKTKVVSLSLVHWCTGMPLPIQEIGKYCYENKIDLILDGAQGVGLVDVDIHSTHVSYMAFPAWKWLLGPLGLGVIFVSKEKLAETVPIFKGQNSVTDADNYLPYKSNWKEGADRYEYSTSSMTDWVYFQSSLRMLEEIGFKTVQSRIYELAEYLATALESIGFSNLNNAFPNPTGIISTWKKDINLTELQTSLKKKNIISAVRLDRLRFAPHIYNSKDQLDRVVSIIDKTLFELRK
jgi:cysteine desulfurase / selenocysteine lyase